MALSRFYRDGIRLDRMAWRKPSRNRRALATLRILERQSVQMERPSSRLAKPMKTEKEKMLAGELYDPRNAELVQARERSRDLCHELNLTRERDQEIRRRILSDLFGSGGDTVRMQPPFYCDYGSNIYLGEGSYFNFNCVVLDVCEVRIGDFTSFGPAVQIYAATHPMNATIRRSQEFGKPVKIGSDVWIGGGAIICPGVTIGSKTVIGAGSIVTNDIPDGVLAAGNPCRIIREIPRDAD